VYARFGPSKLPFAPFELALEIAVRSVSRPMPYDASACVSAWMRTAGRMPPASVTSPTPVTWLIFCASRVLTMFCTSVSGSDAELTASVSTGASAGLTFA
jgi:hypothetical protein